MRNLNRSWMIYLSNMDIKACLSHNSDDWATPSDLYNCFIENGYKDPCPLHSDFDGLLKTYFYSKLYVNPPFSKMSVWCDWCLFQISMFNTIYLLMPVRTDTKYFKKLFISNYISTIIFFHKRLSFNDIGSAPFPCMLVKLEPEKRCTSDIVIKLMSVDEFIRSMNKTGL